MMTIAQLSALDQKAQAQIQQTKESLLRLEGYRLCLADIIKQTAEAEAKAAALVDPPAVPATPPTEIAP